MKVYENNTEIYQIVIRYDESQSVYKLTVGGCVNDLELNNVPDTTVKTWQFSKSETGIVLLCNGGRVSKIEYISDHDNEYGCYSIFVSSKAEYMEFTTDDQSTYAFSRLPSRSLYIYHENIIMIESLVHSLTSEWIVMSNAHVSHNNAIHNSEIHNNEVYYVTGEK